MHFRERVVVVSDGSEAARTALREVARRQDGDGILEVLRVIDSTTVPQEPHRRAIWIDAERAELDHEVDSIARQFPTMLVASRVLVGDPDAVLADAVLSGTTLLVAAAEDIDA
jgi:hypothetical protein